VNVRRTLRVVAATVVAAAATELACAVWIPAKATVAQLLLRSAWRRAHSGSQQLRPWPWADTWPVARLRVSRLGLDLIVLAGASGAALAFGPGHIDGTADPCGSGNCVLAGHRDTSFARLQHARPGDRLELETPKGVIHTYRVSAIWVAHEADTRVLDPTDGEQLTLVTCYPFGDTTAGGPWRWVIRASLETTSQLGES